MSPRIVCLGEGMIEIADAPGAPAVAFGGDAMNTAVYLARLGADAAFASALGTDPYSDDMVGWLQREGVAADLIVRDESRLPGLYMIRNRKDGERDFFYWRSDSAARRYFRSGEGARAVNRAYLSGGALYLTGITLSLCEGASLERLTASVREFRADGGTVVFDMNYRASGWLSPASARAALEAIAPAVTIAMPTLEDEIALYGDRRPEEIAARWREAGASEATVKCGAAGAFVDAAGFQGPVPPLGRVAAIDTTGAGDSFNAAYLAARLRDGLPPEVAAQRANRLAGAVIRHRGAVIPKSAMPAAETGSC